MLKRYESAYPSQVKKMRKQVPPQFEGFVCFETVQGVPQIDFELPEDFFEGPVFRRFFENRTKRVVGLLAKKSEQEVFEETREIFLRKLEEIKSEINDREVARKTRKKMDEAPRSKKALLKAESTLHLKNCTQEILNAEKAYPESTHKAVEDLLNRESRRAGKGRR